MELLKAERLCISFGGLAAVKDVSLCVEDNTIVSLIGPNGAGKTTMFNLLTGFYTCNSGSICFCGEELRALTPEKFVSRGIARTFQNVRLFPQMTVLDNVLVGCQQQIHYTMADALFHTKRWRKAEAQAAQECCLLLDQIGLLEEKDKLCSSLPYGKRKILEIARALASRPKLLLLDEPAAGLNPQETRELSGIVRSLPGNGRAVLLIEHDMGMVMDISDYVYVMDHGVKLAEGKPEEVRGNQQVIEAYVGRGRE